jgi:hypothetical protein
LALRYYAAVGAVDVILQKVAVSSLITKAERKTVLAISAACGTAIIGAEEVSLLAEDALAVRIAGQTVGQRGTDEAGCVQ